MNAIITGTLLEVERNKVEVNARIIKTETAEVIGASSVEIEKIWSDISPTQLAPVAQQPTEVLPSVYTQPPIYTRKQQDVFFDIFTGGSSSKMNLTFENNYSPIDEVDVTFDLNGNGNLEPSVAYHKIGFSDLATESSTPLGFRIGITEKSFGICFEMSYVSRYIKKQNTQVTLNDTSTLNFKFFVNDYLKVNTFLLLSGDLFLQFSDKRPYVGLGLGNNNQQSYISLYIPVSWDCIQKTPG